MRRTRRAAIVSVLLATCFAFILYSTPRVSAAAPSMAIAQARAWIANSIAHPARESALRTLTNRDVLAQSSTDASSSSPTVQTDRADYHPGQTVVVTGTGWQPGAPITLTFHEDLNQPFHPDVAKLTFADGNGTIDTSRPNTPDDDYVLESHDLGVKYILTATGLTAAATTAIIQTTFTDNVGSNLDQCQNIDLTHLADPCGNTSPGAHPTWDNGDVNGQNSQYREGDGLPYREAITGLADGDWIVRLEYDFTQNGRYGIDRLTRYNLTQASNPCLDTTDVDCTVGSPAFTFVMPGDVSSPDTDHPALPNSGQLHIAGGGLLNLGVVGDTATPSKSDVMSVWAEGGTATFVSVDSNVAQTGLATGNSSRSFKFTLNLSGCPEDDGCNVMLGWTGHLASAADWGPGSGAASISGAPFHMRILGIDQTGGTDGGNQDRSVQLSTAVVTTLKVDKVLSPSDDPGRFNLLIDGSSPKINNVEVGTNVGNGGTTGFVDVTGGQHTVGESAVTGTNLFNYSTAISCVDSFGTVVATGTDAGPLNVNVPTGSNVTCTITNTRIRETPTVTTDVHDALHASKIAFDLGATAHDSASVTGSFGTATGTVEFTFYRGGNCTTGTPEAAGTVSLDNGVAHPSTAEGPLAAGNYAFKAHYTPDAGSNYVEASSDCEPLTVSRGSGGSYLFTTDIHLGTDPATPVIVTAPVSLGSTVHDKATVGALGGFTPTGSVDFTFYRGGDCTTGTSETAGSATLDSNGVAHPSSSKGPLGAGSYAFKAHYNGDTNFDPGDSACEPLTVNKANPSVTTIVHDSNETNVGINDIVAQGTTVHDRASVTGITGFAPTGSVSFKFFTNGTCAGDGTASGYKTLDSSGVAHPSSSQGPLGYGSFAFRAHYNGDGNYYGKDSDCEPFTVIRKSIITNTELCTFDIDTGTTGTQFRLIYTPDQNNPSAWKLNASNPGQFYYNVFDNASSGKVEFAIPYPFVTNGAVPIHVYSDVTTKTVNGQTCLVPGPEVAIDKTTITLGSYAQQAFGQTAKVTVNFTTPSGFAYVNIHLDYGLKGTTNYTKNNADDALDATTLALRIKNNQKYTFSVTDGTSDSGDVYSQNVFKRDPGIGGLVLKAGTDQPIAGAQVKITGDGKSQTVTTDADGWYMYQYKYTGKPASFTVQLLASPVTGNYGSTQTVTLKSNGFLVVNFTVP